MWFDIIELINTDIMIAFKNKQMILYILRGILIIRYTLQDCLECDSAPLALMTDPCDPIRIVLHIRMYALGPSVVISSSSIHVEGLVSSTRSLISF